MPKISILIPVYNVELYLQECLESVINQTEKDLEVICVDDASTDSSLKILEVYAQKDKRVTIIRHEENEGLCKSRKDSVFAAAGTYIMFLDSDDYLSLQACEELYTMMNEKNVDFMQFGTYLHPSPGVSEDMVQWVDNFMRPTEEFIEKRELLKACFMDGRFNCNLVNKIWNTTCCKRAYEAMDNGKYISAEDRYAVFLLAYFSNSYAGTQNKYYHYRMGVGVTGGQQLDLTLFEKRCEGARIINQVACFLNKENAFELYEKEFEAFKDDIVMDCVDCWHNKLKEEDYKKGFKILLKHWKPVEIVGAFGKRYFEEQNDLHIRCQEEKENVAIYYRYIGYDAMESILKDYIDLNLERERGVYLVTDIEAPCKEDHYLGCELLRIPDASSANWDQYQNRAEKFYNTVTEKEIRTVYYLSPTSHVAKLDELLLISSKIKFNMVMDEYTLDREKKEKELIRKTAVDLTYKNKGLTDQSSQIKNLGWHKIFYKFTGKSKGEL